MTLDLDAHANEIAGALAKARQIAPGYLDSAPQPIAAAYEIAAMVRKRRAVDRVGLKVGFTNRAIWPIYGVDRPIWGAVFADSCLPANEPVSVSGFSLPRLEPEIVLGLAKAPRPGMSLSECANCIEWIAPGFEIVQSIYAGWKFSVADAIAAQALHGGLVVGPRVAATPERLSGLNAVSVALMKDGECVETGRGANALDGPLSVLLHLVALLPPNEALVPGDIVTTGTLTDAWPISSGEIWTARFEGVLDAELTVDFE